LRKYVIRLINKLGKEEKTPTLKLTKTQAGSISLRCHAYENSRDFIMTTDKSTRSEIVKTSLLVNKYKDKWNKWRVIET